MPAVVAPAIISGALAAASEATILGLTGISAGILVAAGNIALGFVSKALTPKPEAADLSSFASIKSQGISRQIRQPIVERRLVYGEARVSGPIVFFASTDNNKYLHMVIALASHEIEEIGEIFINDVSIPQDAINGSGLVTSGRYANKVRIKKHLGATNQTADSDLVSEVSEWTTNHRLQEIAYIYVRLEFDRNVFPSGIPNFSAWIKGKSIYDTRDASTKWSPNIALITRDYLVDQEFGLSAGTSTIDTTSLNASANSCDEMVTVTNINATINSADSTSDIITLNGDILPFQTGDRVNLTGASLPGGLSTSTNYYVIVYQRKTTPRVKLATSLQNAIDGVAINITSNGTGTMVKNAEPRYFGGGVLKSSAERGNNLEEIFTSMAGQIVFSGGMWKIYAGEYQSPTLSYDENDLIGPIQVKTKVSKRERYNRVQGVYLTPLNDGNPSDFPAITNSTYETEDGEVIKKDINLSFTQRPHTAQRIAKIFLERSRQEIVFEASFKLTAFKLQVGDNFYFTFDRYGWTNKIFEVIDWSLGIEQDSNGVDVPVINLVCRENASAVYDWNNGEETAVDPAPNTDLPSPFDVPVVIGFSLDSVPISTKEFDRVFSVRASWDLSTDQFVLSGGRYEVEFKQSTATNYDSAGQVDGTVTELILSALQPDVLYDVRIFAYNSLGAKSDATEINNFQAGDTVTTNTEDWENESNARDNDDWEVDGLDAEDWDS